MASWQYRYEAVSADGFVEQLVRYVNTGHYFYVTGCIPLDKVSAQVDRKLLDRYRIMMPRWERSRRKRAGIASVHYLRFERFFVLLATHGQHPYFEAHSPEQIHDCRRIGIKFNGYSIRHGCCQRTGKWHTLVRLDKPTYVALKSHFLELALRRSVEKLADEFWAVGFQPYRPVREQLLAILRATNAKRKRAGLPVLAAGQCIRDKRRITKPFGEQSDGVQSAATDACSSNSGRMRPISEASD